MTAEVAILNKSAIAVAADSAVTVGNNKVHRSANKIFSVCDAEPLGLMVYGNGEFCGLPWETLAKLYRQRFGRVKHKTVRDCFESFRKFLASAEFFQDRQQKLNLMLFATDVIERIHAIAQTTLDKTTGKDLTTIIDVSMAQFSDDEADAPRFKLPSLRAFRGSCTDLISAVCDEVFDPSVYKVPNVLRPRFVELVWRALCNTHRSRFLSGVVIFGFGEVELLPQLVAEEFDGCCLGHLRSMEQNVPSINQQNSAAIFPFADREVMTGFMEGANQRTQAVYGLLIQFMMENVAERIIKANFSPSPQEYTVIKAINDKIIKDIMETFSEQISAWIHLESIGPIVDVVAGMPKEELAALAEALVEVTAARSKVVDAVESVGGDVDVCVVTKGDGLIWIKRKHYFDLAKNQQYLHRRFAQ
jgi:hypothetical protein